MYICVCCFCGQVFFVSPGAVYGKRLPTSVPVTVSLTPHQRALEFQYPTILSNTCHCSHYNGLLSHLFVIFLKTNDVKHISIFPFHLFICHSCALGFVCLFIWVFVGTGIKALHLQSKYSATWSTPQPFLIFLVYSLD